MVNLVRGLKVEAALAQLKFTANEAARPLQKLIRSAIANAEHNLSLAADSLKISIFKVDGGPVFKRFRPNSRGRTAPLKKRTAHVTLILEGERRLPKSEKTARKTDVSETAGKKEEFDKKGITEDVAAEEKRSRDFRRKPGPKQSSGFVKRMFQRKAI